MDEAFREAVERNIKMVTESDVFASLWNPAMADFRSDPLPAMQLAIAILADKPVILMLAPDANPPPKLVQLADAIIRGGPEEWAAGLKQYFAEHPLP